MKIFLAQEFIKKFPDYIRFVIVAKGIDNTREYRELKQMLAEREEIVKTIPASEYEGRLSAWERAFRRFGANPSRYKPSHQALIEKVRDGGGIPYHNTIVALSNYISLKYFVPSGADDLDRVDGDFGLKLARGNEIFVAIGSNRVERPKPGEVIYADKRKVMCRRWVWRQGVHTMVEPETINAVINIDVLPPITYEEGEKAAGELVELIKKFCGGEVVCIALNKECPAEEIEPPTERREQENNVYDVLEIRGYIEQTSDRAAVRDLLSSRSAPTTIYEGFDPTKPSLHVGHLMSLMVMHYLQEAGHRVIFILGGGTAQIGDPSMRKEARKMISPEEVWRNGEAIKRQVQGMGLVNFEEEREGKPKAIMLDNIEWLNMPLLEYAREVTPHFSVNTMIKREDFAYRLKRGINLSLFEFIYTTLQAYDFLYLYDKYGCMIQMGGNDQWINILDGVELIRRKREGKTYAMTFPLLVDRTGQKMGKTATGETIWLAAEGECSTSPFNFYQYWVNCPDEDLERNFKIFTFLPLDEIDEILAGDPREAQHRLAFEVTKIVHGERIARQVQLDAFRAFGRLEGIPERVPTFNVKESELRKGLLLRQALVDSGSVSSLSEARRLIEQGGVRLNGVKLTDINYILRPDDFMEQGGERAAIVRYGKGKVLKILLLQ
jgi:tyrosyl-tRNA synthetase